MIMKQRINLSGLPFTDLANDFEKVIENVFGDLKQSDTDWAPRANVLETEGNYSVELELPGINPEDVAVELTDGVLEVSGTKSVTADVDGIQVLKSERRHGSFRRTFKFSIPLNADGIAAEFKHGILTVVLPKAETVLPKKIQIKVAD